uniref:pre-mRNA 3'-end-processing factor FIP1 n=1 Tax=Centroberyx gerrardi TaxID=166262 RepID=UPI003AAABC5A
MSAVDSDKNKVTDASSGKDEEEWLYGDDREEKAEDQVPASKTTMPCPKEAHENGADTQAGQDDQDNDSDSDYDDDVFRVTIGDIKTEDSSQSTSSGRTPVNLNIKTEGKVHAVVGTKSKGVDASGSIKGIPVLDVDVESFEEKPWGKPGADISDYFNYGFNEETWKAYCEKQWRLRANFESMTLSSTKIMVQRGRTGHGEKDSWCGYPSSSNPYISAPRKTRVHGTIDVIGGHCGSISRVEGRRRHSNEGNNIQVLSETSSDGAKIISFPPFNIPPPPLLPSPSNINSAPPLIPPPPFPHPPGVRPPPLIPNLDSGCSGSPPIPPYPFSPGVHPLIPGSVTSWAGVIDSAKAWEYYIRQDRERERDKGRDRSRERGREKDRGRDGEREHSPSQAHNSEEERTRDRDTTERGYDRHRSDRYSREKEERPREWRRRDKDEGWLKSSRSSRRRHDGEEDSHHRHKHKRAKRSGEDKETSNELSADEENQS